MVHPTKYRKDLRKSFLYQLPNGGGSPHCILIIKANIFPRPKGGQQTPKQKSQLNSVLEVVKVYEVEIFSESSVLGLVVVLPLATSFIVCVVTIMGDQYGYCVSLIFDQIPSKLYNSTQAQKKKQIFKKTDWNWVLKIKPRA